MYLLYKNKIMWKIFQNTNNTIIDTIQPINDWKITVFSQIDIEVKKYFASKLVVYFDNMMLLNQTRGMHENLLESLSIAEKDMQNSSLLFPDIYCYWLPENNNSFLITLNLPNNNLYYPINIYGFNFIKKESFIEEHKLDVLNNSSWKNLIFSLRLSEFSKGWIDYTPNLEERAYLQTKYIILNNNILKSGTLLENISLEENIKNYPKFEELYNKILRIMPKIESSLEDEWRSSIVSGLNTNVKLKKKNF